jgi:PTH1 family peptidyl-tRNA hydrolase
MARRLIVGLGNPGAQYRATRHNVGFLVMDRLLATHAPQTSRRKFDAELFEVRDGGVAWLLLKPQTFMNLSGKSVAAAVRFYDLDLADLLVVCDDFNLPLGRLRMRREGSHGGQRGLADIMDRLGTNAFARLRLGIEAPRGGAIDHVLGTFAPDEKSIIEEAVARAAQAVECWARDGAETAMNRFNAA